MTIAIAKAEGWHGRSGSKWKTIPQQMLQYRAGSWLIRAVAPELSLGMHTSEELVDVYEAEPEPNGANAWKFRAGRPDRSEKTEPPEKLESEIVVDAKTGEIAGSDEPGGGKPAAPSRTQADAEPPLSELAEKILGTFDGLTTLAEIGKKSNEIRGDKRLAPRETVQLLARLKIRQADVKRAIEKDIPF